jgi:hypothetical protein
MTKDPKNTIIEKMLTYASETLTLTERDRKLMNIFERKVYRRILDPVKKKKKEKWRILTNKEIYAVVKNPAVTETIRLNILVGLDMYREWKKIEFYVLVWTCIESGRKWNCMCWFGHV